MDSISLHNIEVTTRIGVPDTERASEQQLLVSVELFHPTKDTAESDDTTQGIDYALVTEAIIELGKEERKTVERLAEDIATMILLAFKPKGGVKVSIEKRPPLPLESVSITITRP